ncbi:hypothetical protein Kpho02_76210 [Kitasatospora phosalacinea]|uniref:Uncharacterized protein n=1 Tax=Kitasatospora phosalacinea TaxID=2065 RepID=A0A9W6QHW3_9ACTN|nr:hypothetical protein [Kitasatospora phosalacinea]GLW75324.1 hypothetical protein Kpho02_76210 [Kitasatospora phosalacinea]
MDLLEFTTVVNRAGSGFGFAATAVPALFIKAKTKSWHTLKDRTIWQPWAYAFVVLVLASAVSGGLIKKLSNGFTGTGNVAGQAIGAAAIGQSGDGALTVSFGQVMSYGGGWIVLVCVLGLGFFVWFADSWGTRALYLAGAVTGSTWGITSALGGWAAMLFIPLFSWISDMVIG